MLAVAGMQDGGVSATRMNADIDWEIPQFDLPAHGSERPLVGKQNRTVALFARPIGLGSAQRRAGRGRQGSDFPRRLDAARCREQRQGDQEKRNGPGKVRFIHVAAVCASDFAPDKAAKVFGAADVRRL